MKKIDHFFARTCQFAYVPFKTYSAYYSRNTNSKYELTTKDKWIGRFIGFLFYGTVIMLPILNSLKHLTISIAILDLICISLPFLGCYFCAKELKEFNSIKTEGKKDTDFFLTELHQSNKKVNSVE